jgi:hypothetical protein
VDDLAVADVEARRGRSSSGCSRTPRRRGPRGELARR